MSDRLHGSETRMMAAVAFCWALIGGVAVGQPPVLETVFPAGGQAGQSVEVTLSGSHLEGATLHTSAPGVACEPIDSKRFRLSLPTGIVPGHYDIWAVGANGVSAPRAFVVSDRPEILETESGDPADIPLHCVVHGRMDAAADADAFRFTARRDQRVLIECQAERVDSRLRAVLEIWDADGKRLEVNRGYFGIDPVLDFRVPADGSYVVKVFDLTGQGGVEYFYRLAVDTGPRVAFAFPPVVERGKAARVELFGWNLSSGGVTDREDDVVGIHVGSLDRLAIDIPATQAEPMWPLPVRMQPAQAALQGFAVRLPGSSEATFLGVTDAPVHVNGSQRRPSSTVNMMDITVPCEVTGQLADGDQVDWYALSAARGEVFYFEAFAQRINSPVDLQLIVLDDAQRELARFGDERRGGGTFATTHLDPVGRWVAPANGRYLLAVRNLIGGTLKDVRRIYRLSVRREEPEFQLIAVPHAADSPLGLNVPRGGRVAIDVLALRRRGMSGGIRVSATNLPAGLTCPDVWLGPEVDRTTLVLSADRDAVVELHSLTLQGFVAPSVETDTAPEPAVVKAGTVVRSGTPVGWGRLASQLPLAVAGDAPVRITANGHEPLDHHLYGTLRPRHSPGGVLDIVVEVDRRDTAHQADVRLTAVGLPDLINRQASIIPAGENRGYLSFYLPPTLPTGHYSLVIRAETTVPGKDNKAETVVTYSEPITFEVQPAAFEVQADPFVVTKARRGETIQIGYSARRLNGFIGKMHTELAAPGCVTNVEGLRGRGETFVGQTDRGSLQVIINDDAPLGRQMFLRLFTVGVVEDDPIFQGSCFLSLEIVE